MKLKALFLSSIMLLSACAHNPSLRGPASVKQNRPVYTIKKYGDQKLFFKQFDFPVDNHPEVQKWIRFFTENQSGRYSFDRYLFRGEKYFGFLREMLYENDMPQDLVFLSMIESGFNNYASSSASAVGLWQFMKPTGERFGLVVNPFIDERRDPVKSTYAAIEYLSFLYDHFKDWRLAIAAYNCGEQRVRNAMKSANSSNYWTLVSKKALPEETSDYVPKMMAVMILTKNAEAYGFRLKSLESTKKSYWQTHGYKLTDKSRLLEDLHKPSSTGKYEKIYEDDKNYKYFATPLKALPVKQPLDLIRVAKFLDITYEEIKVYNPQVVGWFVNPEHVSEIYLPESLSIGPDSLKAELFKPVFRTQKVAKAATWFHLAKQYNIREEALRMFNPRLPRDKKVKAGQRVILPIPSYKTNLVLGVERTADN